MKEYESLKLGLVSLLNFNNYSSFSTVQSHIERVRQQVRELAEAEAKKKVIKINNTNKVSFVFNYEQYTYN